MKKKILSLVLALCMVLAVLPGGALAASGDFVIRNGVLTEYTGAGGNVNIPSGVTTIGDSAFVQCAGLTGVTIPSGVTKIGETAFAFCTNLASVSIPSSVTEIGAGAFGECTSLTAITIPSGVTKIGELAFAFCTGLTSVTIPSSVTEIGDSAFGECTGLTSVTIPSGVAKIGANAFALCSGLTSVRIPSSVIQIGDDAFGKCENLTDIYYSGTEAQWKALNYAQKGATIHYNSTGPATPSAGGTTISFSDVASTAWYAEPVAWAIGQGITNGTSATSFSPNKTCTQGEILTFLWRAKGEPAPAGTVTGTKFYATAAQWAQEQGLTDNFSGDAPCTRAMVVTYLWKLAGSPDVGAPDFSDVSAGADYAQAVAWAVKNEITNGTSATTFAPNDTCTRGQIVTFLYRALA